MPILRLRQKTGLDRRGPEKIPSSGLPELGMVRPNERLTEKVNQAVRAEYKVPTTTDRAGSLTGTLPFAAVKLEHRRGPGTKARGRQQ